MPIIKMHNVIIKLMIKLIDLIWDINVLASVCDYISNPKNCKIGNQFINWQNVFAKTMNTIKH